MSQAAAVKLTALEHLRELWLRLSGSLLVMFIGGGGAYFIRLQIIRFLQRPLHQKLYYTSPTGSFQFVMQVCLLCGFILALPFLLYNVLRFIEPVFTKGFSRRFVLAVLGSSMLLTILGVSFGYYVTLPVALQFFSSVGTTTLLPLISINEYFSFILGYLATFAIVFQLPLLLLFINHIRPFKPGGLTKFRKYLYVGAFAISLIMPSSPDPLSQVSLAIPIISLFEISVLLIWVVNRKRNKVDRAAKHTAPVPQTTQQPVQSVARQALGELWNEATEPFSISRLQERMRQREQPNIQKVAKEVETHIVQQVVHAARKDYQRPINRNMYTTARVGRQGGMINDIVR